jgi:RHS repeat-associated protein
MRTLGIFVTSILIFSGLTAQIGNPAVAEEIDPTVAADIPKTSLVDTPLVTKVQLVTDQTVDNQTDKVKLTAITDTDVSLTDDYIHIVNNSTNETVSICETGKTCEYEYQKTDYAEDVLFYVKTANLTSNEVKTLNDIPDIFLYSSYDEVITGESFYLYIQTEAILPENKDLYFVSTNDNSIVASCVDLISRCEATYQEINASEEEEYIAYVANASASGSYANLTGIVAQSNTTKVTRTPWIITLQAETPYINEGTRFALNGKTNQNVPDNLQAYIYDITDDKILSLQNDSSCANDVSTHFCTTEFAYDTSHSYKSVLAAVDENLNSNSTFEDFSSIRAESNVVTLRQIPWVLNLYPEPYWLDESVIVYTGTINQNPTNYLAAIIDGTTGEIFELCNTTCTTAPEVVEAGQVEQNGIEFVIGKWNGDNSNLNPPASAPGGSMTDIQASISFAPTVSIPVASNTNYDISTPSRLTGGSNPSQKCAQTCAADPVNVVTGEFWLDDIDLETQSSIPLSFARYYGISKRAVKGSMGFGWNTNFDMKLAPVNTGSLNTATTVSVTQENGSLIEFKKNSIGNWETDLKTKATLVESSDSFTFTRNKLTTFVFNKTGVINSVKDLNENTLTFNYLNNKLNTISNGKGQQLTFAWNTSNLISSISKTGGENVQYKYTASNELSEVKYSDGTLISYAYDSSHAMTSFKDPKGNVTSNVYDSKKRVKTQTDALNKATTFTYEYGLTTIKQPNGRLDKHHYNQLFQVYHVEKGNYSEYNEFDAANQLILTTLPDGSTIETSYNANGNAIQTKDRAGNVTNITYDNFNHVLSETNAANSSRSYTYDVKGNLTSSTDFNGNLTLFTINPDGTTEKITAVDGSETSFAYNAQGLANQITDSSGNVTSQTFTPDGKLVTSTDALNRTTTYTYDAVGQAIEVQYPNGSKELNFYDSNGNVVKSTDPLGKDTSYEYDALNRQTSLTDPLNRITKQQYDSMGNVVKTIDALNKETTSAYNLQGELTKITNANAKVTSFFYNNMSQLIKTTNARTKNTFYNYDANGNNIEVIDHDGIKTSNSYNSIGLLVKATDVQRKKTTYTYDANGNLLTTTLPNLSVSSTIYNSLNQKTSFTDTDGGVKNWSYDEIGNLATFTNTDNSVTEYSYDAVGNPLTINRPDNTSVSYEYSNLNQPTKEIYSDSTMEFSYNDAGQLVKEKQGTDEIVYAYDNAGNVTSRGPPVGAKVSYSYTPRNEISSITYPSGKSINYAYDNVGNMTSAANTVIGNFSYTYDANNNLATSTNPNGTTQAYTYNNTDSLTKTLVKNATKTLYEKQYAYSDSTGLLASTSTIIRVPATKTINESFTYDSLMRLDSSSSGQVSAGKYNYSNTGNLTNKLGTQQQFNSANQLISSNNSTFELDSRGNRISTSSTAPTEESEYTYNQENKLTKLTTDSTETSYEYDASGLIKLRTQDNVSDKFIWDQQTSVPLLLDDDDYEYFYTVGNSPVAQINSSTNAITYLHSDGLGSVVAATSANGSQLGIYIYSAYGEIETPSGAVDTAHSITRFGFAGEWRDPDTELYNLRARWYEPSTGTFINRDPIEQSTNEPYSYGSGNPLAYTDPLGLFGWTDVAQFGLGALDSVTLGASSAVLNKINPSIIDECNSAFKWGGITADIASIAIPGAGAAVIGIKIIAKLVKKGIATKAAKIATKTQNNVAIGPKPPSYGWPPIKQGESNGTRAGLNFTAKMKDSIKKENPDNICVFCRMTASKDPGMTHIDHVIPKSKKGNATLDNGQVACQHCNTSKNNNDYPLTAPKDFFQTFPNESWPPSWIVDRFDL